MEHEQVSIGPKGRTTYRCVAGHDLRAEDVLETTQVEPLDEGAVVRLCREHGAPIALRIAPERHDR